MCEEEHCSIWPAVLTGPSSRVPSAMRISRDLTY